MPNDTYTRYPNETNKGKWSGWKNDIEFKCEA